MREEDCKVADFEVSKRDVCVYRRQVKGRGLIGVRKVIKGG